MESFSAALIVSKHSYCYTWLIVKVNFSDYKGKFSVLKLPPTRNLPNPYIFRVKTNPRVLKEYLGEERQSRVFP